ncbi:MAG: hypothetical protein LBL63_05195, partial [Clostridiales Family XIII bacterium]|nr:hypothetical protein [Clostridiales Family XIII bacterium]
MNIRLLKKPSRWTTGVSGYVLLLGALIINIGFQGESFFSAASFGSLLSSNLPLIIAALAQMMVMTSGGIDISLGNIMALTNGVAIALSNTHGMPVLTSFLIAALAGTLVGFGNGIIIAYLRISPLLVTFAMSMIVKGISLLVLPKPGGSVPTGMYKIYGGEVLGIPTAVWLIVLTVAALLSISKFKISRHMIAIGSNERNAYIS